MALTLLPASNFSLASFWFASASKYVCTPAWQYDFPNYWSGKHTQHSNTTVSCETKTRPLKDLQVLIGFFWLWSSIFLSWEYIRTSGPKPIVCPSINGRKAFKSKLQMDFDMFLQKRNRASRLATLSRLLSCNFLHDFDVNMCQQSQDFPTSTQPKGDFDVNDFELSSRSLTDSTLPKGGLTSWFLAMPQDWKADATSGEPGRLPTLKVGLCSTHLTCPWHPGRDTDPVIFVAIFYRSEFITSTRSVKKMSKHIQIHRFPYLSTVSTLDPGFHWTLDTLLMPPPKRKEASTNNRPTAEPRKKNLSTLLRLLSIELWLFKHGIPISQDIS